MILRRIITHLRKQEWTASGPARRLDMSDPYWQTVEQMERLRPHFPNSHAKPKMDDRRVLIP